MGPGLDGRCKVRPLLELGQGSDLLFESLVILALNLKFGLQFFDEQFQVRNFGTQLVNFHG